MYQNDWSGSFLNARNLARSIEGYWRRRGFHWVQVWIERDERTTEAKLWHIRSNIKLRAPETEEDLENAIE